MFDQVKDQIKGYLPEKLSPVVSAFIVGTITFIVVAILLSAEIIRPGITDLVPPLILQMMVLTITTFLAGIVAWIVGKRQAKSSVLPIKKEVVNGENESSQEKFFNYNLKHNRVSYTAINNTRAVYEDERVFVATGNVKYAMPIEFWPSDPSTQIRLIDMDGYKLRSIESLEELKQWRKSLVLETNFRGPVKTGSENSVWVKFEVPPHLGTLSKCPVKGSYVLTIDLRKLGTIPPRAKLFTFISDRATNPLVSTTSVPVKTISPQGQLRWVIRNPKINYYYVVSWKEPCECSWCKRINFG